MREQVCIYMCPWPRIQTAMLDEKSLIVTYKDWRGEPRGSVKKAEAQPGSFGDCIDCNQCVAVCPTGIDIREGPQIGCITCALCIDACDSVMEKVNRPRDMVIGMTELKGAVMWSNAGSRDGAGKSLVTKVPADSVSRLRLYVAAPGEGPVREDFALTVTAADDAEANDIDEVFFERPETGE